MANGRGKGRPGTRRPAPATADELERAALRYLERYASSAENLRRVLMRRVLRAARHDGSDPEDGARLVDALVARYERAGLLDDRRYAEARARALHAGGGSVRAIAARLRAKGVERDDVDAAVAAVAEEAGVEARDGLDLRAACAFARKRRLGPYRAGPADRERRQRELAALGRAGFGYETARTVVEAESVAALTAEAGIQEGAA